jgi:hypothetical protein
MIPLAADWPTIASLGTAAGTLVLAVATFASVRSANRSARISEQALQEQRRPIFAQSRLDDPVQKIMFVEQHWVRAAGGHGVAEHDGYLYFAVSLRNVGSGIGVCQGWYVSPGMRTSRTAREHTPEERFRLQSRDLYIPAGDIGMWQGALRDRNDPTYQAVAEAIDNQQMISIELLYSDQVGGQRTISRFGLVPYQNNDGQIEWFASINRHWYLDAAGPRSEEQIAAAVDQVVGDRKAAEAADADEERAARAQAEAEAEEEQELARRDAEEEQAAARTDDTLPRITEPVSVITRPNCE